jgi:hypothetical protein
MAGSAIDRPALMALIACARSIKAKVGFASDQALTYKIGA